MDSKDYDVWKNHPQTVQFFQYLKDYRLDMMERWAQGGLVGEDSLMAIARAQMADEIVNLDDDAISEFYRNRNGEVKDVE